MFGYVRPNASRLPKEAQKRFHSAYCGLCHALERRCGFVSRFLLNYDFTLLSILLSLGQSQVKCSRRRCISHPCAGCEAMEGSAAMDAAADLSVILAWWQLRDHIADHGFFASIPYRIAALFLRGAYARASAHEPDFDAAVRARLGELAALEREGCPSLDAAAEPFAALLAEASNYARDEKTERVLRQLFYHLGRWIYIVDAADDFRDDAKSGNYNPLRCRYGIEGDELPDDIRQAVGETLDASVRRMADAYALLDAGEWTGVLDSVFYDSLYGIGKAVLCGEYKRAGRKELLTGEEHE